nr:MAG TPA: hypothetical protein [Caudoviricetes sp.]
MIKSDMNYNLLYTHGDTLALQYDIGNYALEDGDSALLSIKRQGEIVLQATISTPGVSILQFIISAEDMLKLPVGRYTYDMCINFADGRVYTTDYIREFRIVEVAHE